MNDSPGDIAVTEDLEGCYRALELETGASFSAVRRSYRNLVKLWHPDRFTAGSLMQEKAQEKLKAINLAYERLGRKRGIDPNRDPARQNQRKTPRPPQPSDPEEPRPRPKPREEPEPEAQRPGAGGEEPAREPARAPRGRHPSSQANRERAPASPPPDPAAEPRPRFFRPGWAWTAACAAGAAALIWVLVASARREALHSPEPGDAVAASTPGDSGEAAPPVAEGAPAPASSGATAARSDPLASVPAIPRLSELERGPRTGAGHPEPSLPTNLAGTGSARLDSAARRTPAAWDAQGAQPRSQAGPAEPGLNRPSPGGDFPKVAAGAAPPAPADDGGYFTIGSRPDEVIAVQGLPDSHTERIYQYGSSLVTFRDGRVAAWRSGNPALRARLPLGSLAAAAGYFTVGSRRDEVIAVQGKPDSFTPTLFLYGSSTVVFEGDRVVSWRDGHPRLKARLFPILPKPLTPGNGR